ncbi:MAG: sodium/glutamate symporter [Burkholderiaceae bacterium]|jgi:ESS family glutamate:Na+ symporter|nr:sodium/glutamate symporter [Burkholderiaceae bacterium]
MRIELSPVWTLIAALLTIEIGKRLNRWLPWLEAGNIPPAVSGGLLLSVMLALARHAGWFDVVLAGDVRGVLLLAFFASLGFAAHLGRLATAGTAALVVCVAVVVAIAAQNAIGVAVARAFDQPPALGLFMGSVAYLGGHGTATAWAGAEAAQSLRGAFEIGVGSATLGLVLGGLVAGPVAALLMSRARPSTAAEAPAAAADAAPVREPAFSSDRWLPSLLWLLLCLGLSPWLGALVERLGGPALPGFLTALLTGVALTNAADALRRPLDTEVTDLVGTVALRLFLAIALLSLDWMALLDHLPMLLAAAGLQVAGVVAVAAAVVYLLMGRDRDAAAAAGGFIGFGLGAMPVGLAVMRRLNLRYGDTPRAILAITLAASLFPDTANALALAALFARLGQ